MQLAHGPYMVGKCAIMLRFIGSSQRGEFGAPTSLNGFISISQTYRIIYDHVLIHLAIKVRATADIRCQNDLTDLLIHLSLLSAILTAIGPMLVTQPVIAGYYPFRVLFFSV